MTQQERKDTMDHTPIVTKASPESNFTRNRVYNITEPDQFASMHRFFEDRSKKTPVYSGDMSGEMTTDHVDRDGLNERLWFSLFLWKVNKWSEARGKDMWVEKPIPRSEWLAQLSRSEETRMLSHVLNMIKIYLYAKDNGKFMEGTEIDEPVILTISPFVAQRRERT